MPGRLEMTRHFLEYAYRMMSRNVDGITLEEALYVPEGGHRSVSGTLKHAAGWSHVYRSFAFDPEPKHWQQIDWPHGLRYTIIKSQRYVDDVIAGSIWDHDLLGESDTFNVRCRTGRPLDEAQNLNRTAAHQEFANTKSVSGPARGGTPRQTFQTLR